ncbi:MAG: GbpC/Spa domain-containing protein, partial [Lactobacillus delbrueckii]|nr:GbpC/Spa domain-containing protein [Lactobacillus delbrueckii]
MNRVRKKNKIFVDSADRTPHYSLRKLSVGVASVLLSTTLWMGANGSVAHAATINGTTVAGEASNSAENKSVLSETPARNGQGQPAESTNSANAEAQPTPQTPVSAPKSAEEQASTAGQAPAAATEGQTNSSANAGAAIDATTKAKKDSANPEVNSSDAATKGTKKMVMSSLASAAKLANTANFVDDSQNQAIIEVQHQISDKEGDLSSLTNRAEQEGLTVNKEDDKTYADKQEALADLDKQAADIQSKVTKYEAEKAAYDAAKKVYDEDLNKWKDAQSSTDPHMIKGISQGLSFANEHDASLAVTSVSDNPVKFIKYSAWRGSDGNGVYTDGMTSGGNISKSFSESEITYSQAEGTGTDGKKNWGKTYTGVQLKVGESVVARYTGLKNSVYIDKAGVAHKLSQAQVKYTLNETTANDGTANIFLSNNPNIALWYGAAGGQRNGRVDLTVDLTFYDENGKPITVGQGSNAWLDMSSLNNGTTKVEYFAPKGNTTMYIPGSTIVKHDDGWYADNNNEMQPPAPKGWDNPDSADRYYGAAIMELEGNSFHIGQKITKYNPKLTNSRNVYSWFALDSNLATAYQPVEPKEPDKPNITWHGVTYEPQKATVTYIDDTTNTDLKKDEISGDSNSVASNKNGTPYTTGSSIDDYKKKGYELVSDSTDGKQLTFDDDSSKDQHFVVHLKHGTSTKPISDDVNRTINYTMSDGSKAPAQVKDAIHFSGTQTIDNVTNVVTDTTWDPNKGFTDVTSPAAKGYTPDRTVVSDKDIAHDHADIVENVVYNPENQKLDVVYHDDTTNTDLKKDEISGDSNSVASNKDGTPYTTGSSIDDYKKKGYELVSDSTDGKQLTFDDDSSKDQ